MRILEVRSLTIDKICPRPAFGTQAQRGRKAEDLESGMASHVDLRITESHTELESFAAHRSVRRQNGRPSLSRKTGEAQVEPTE